MTTRPEALPIAAYREEIVRRLRTDRVLIVVGETGSGKTTQLCQYALDDGLVAPGRMVAVSQPRRVAAVAAARRVAEERGCAVGAEVAHTVRFDDTVSERTRIRYITDGSLLREAIDSPRLERYSLIIMDEAHERSINTDVLFGLLRRLLHSGARLDLRLVVASATLDVAKFSAFFDGCADVRVPGRTFPVDIFHAAPSGDATDRARAGREGQYVENAVELCMRLHRTRPVGPCEDILIFLTGAKEIALACAALEQLAALDAAQGAGAPLLVLPLHAGLSADAQARVFAPSSASERKVVVATNIAETSLTIDGVRCVVDCGYAKLHSYDSARGMELLTVQPISQAAARQRAGRAGRTQAGECYRLYSEREFAQSFPAETEPEIRRAGLASTALALKSMGVTDLLSFPLLDPPPRAALLRALLQLFAIGALDESGALTPLGRRVSRLPVEPRLGAALAMASELGCVDELATIAAMLSGEEPFLRAAGSEAEEGGWCRARAGLAAAARRSALEGGAPVIDVREADHLLLLVLYGEFARAPSAAAAAAWAAERGVHLRAMRAARDVRAQLLTLVQSSGVARPADRTGGGTNGASCVARESGAAALAAEPLGRRIRRAICAGYFENSVRRIGAGGDVCVPLAAPPGALGGGQGAAASNLLHPLAQSAAVLSGAHTFVYHELIWTASAHMRHLCRIEGEWLEAPLRRLRSTVDPLVLAGARPSEPAPGRVAGSGGTGAEGEAGLAPRRATADERVQAARERFLKRRRCGAASQ